MQGKWVALIAVVALVLGLVGGLMLGAGPGMIGGMVAGSSYGACSVAMDLIDQKAMSREQAEEYYGRFSGRLEALLSSSGAKKTAMPLFSKCAEDIEKFRVEAAKEAKK